jgi:hypothetical protein
LSLRLALVALLARRGVELPMILDDVLVNFDAQRAVAAVEVLHDFSQRGHQLLLLTCHEHLALLFANHQLDVRRLPSNHQAGRALPMVLPAVPPQPPPRRIRPKRIKEETPDLPVTVEAVVIEIPTVDVSVVEPLVPAPVGPLRVDLPQTAIRPSPIMKRWAAEEFSGELDDRINPLWLMDEAASSAD